jgi:ADP-heptose:LPS heptosyltransferase
MATPIARGIKRKHPESHVTYAVPTDYAGGDLLDLLLYNPYIDEIIDYKIVSRDDYDAFADITRAGLAEEVRAAKNRVVPKNRIDLFSEESGFPLYGMTRPIYVMLEEERAWGKDFAAKQVAGKKPRGLIAVHLRSNDPKRTWPKDRVREFLTLCAKHNYHTFLFGWGDNADEWRISGTTLVFNYKIRQAAAILDACDLLVCPDSSMLHLAGALNKRIVSLFGSMPPACRINHYPNAIAVVNQKLSCLGCLYEPCHQNFYCMSSLLPEAVLSAVEMQLKQDIRQPNLPESIVVNSSSFEQDILGTEIKSFEI